MTRPRSFKAIAADMAALLDRMAFGLDVLPVLIPDEKRHEQDKESPRSGFEPSAIRLAAEARVLVAEHRERVEL